MWYIHLRSSQTLMCARAYLVCLWWASSMVLFTGSLWKKHVHVTHLNTETRVHRGQTFPVHWTPLCLHLRSREAIASTGHWWLEVGWHLSCRLTVALAAWVEAERDAQFMPWHWSQWQERGTWCGSRGHHQSRSVSWFLRRQPEETFDSAYENLPGWLVWSFAAGPSTLPLHPGTSCWVV